MAELAMDAFCPLSVFLLIILRKKIIHKFNVSQFDKPKIITIDDYGDIWVPNLNKIGIVHNGFFATPHNTSNPELLKIDENKSSQNFKSL